MRAPSPATIRTLRDSVETKKGEHMDLLRELVVIPSHSTIPGGTEAVAALVLPRLDALNFNVVSVDQSPLKNDSEWIEKIMIPDQHQDDLGPTYCASREGESDGTVLLLGDLDTAYPLDQHEAFPIRQEGSLFYGPGAADMKGGLVVMLAALDALHNTGMATPPIEIVLSADEQAGSLGSRRVIYDVAARCQWTLCFECARRGGQIMAARGHIGIGDLTAIGVEAHAGSAYADGVNATDYLARVIPPVNALTRLDEDILVTVTLLQAGRRRSVIPDRASAVLDIRTPSLDDWQETVKRIKETVAEFGEGMVSVRTYAHRPGVLWSADTDALLALIRECGTGIGVEINAFSSAAAGSTAFAAEGGSIVMDGMGPLGGGLMTHDEHVDTRSIPERAAILAGTLMGLANPEVEVLPRR